MSSRTESKRERKLDRARVCKDAVKQNNSNMRDSDTIKHLNMYNNGKAIRNRDGTAVGRQFTMGDRAGDTKITGVMGRIALDGCWFGNTGVVGITDLDKFCEEMSEKVWLILTPLY
uniref:Nucleolar GTP-binding protein 2 N-terminal domain-containing protein n=1 Tax=Ditylum brightwellii TaxID=49249 RepID=A0A7S4SMI4_9STRA